MRYAVLFTSGAASVSKSSHPWASRLHNSSSINCSLQVKHFDTLRDKEVRFLQKLHDNINKTATKAAGGLAGTHDKAGS